MTDNRVQQKLWGPFSGLGLALGAFAFAADQLHKWWMIHVYDIGSKGTVEITSFLNLVMLWNPGISYGLLQQDGFWGRSVLIVFALIAVVVMIYWLAQCESTLGAAALGLIIGGALGNVVDRLIYGAVADFFSFHAFGFYWYIFNIADVAIVAGVAGLLYDFIFHGRKKVSNAS